MGSQDMSSRKSETCLAISDKISQFSNYVKRKFHKSDSISGPINLCSNQDHLARRHTNDSSHMGLLWQYEDNRRPTFARGMSLQKLRTQSADASCSTQLSPQRIRCFSLDPWQGTIKKNAVCRTLSLKKPAKISFEDMQFETLARKCASVDVIDTDGSDTIISETNTKMIGGSEFSKVSSQWYSDNDSSLWPGSSIHAYAK